MKNYTYYFSFFLFFLISAQASDDYYPSGVMYKTPRRRLYRKPTMLESMANNMRNTVREVKDYILWDWDNCHKDTGAEYDKRGWSKYKRHKDTGTQYNPEGYDIFGYNKKGYNQFGRYKNGFFPANEMPLIYVRGIIPKNMRKKIPVELKGLIKIFLVGQSSLENEGFLKKIRFNIFTLSEYNLEGYTLDGFNKSGIHIDTDNRYNRYGFDKNGFHKDTSTKYDLSNFDRNGIHKDTKTKYNTRGYDRVGRRYRR